MSALSSSPTDELSSLLRWGLYALFALACGLVMLLGAWSPWASLTIPAAIAAGLGLTYIISRPRLHLVLVLLSFVVLFRYTEGVQLDELIVNIFFISYIVGWMVKTVFFDRVRLVYDIPDLLIAGFLFYVSASVALVPLTGGDLLISASQYRSILVLALYFPIKRYISEDPKFLKIGIYVFVFYIIFLIIRNAWWYYSALHDSTALWQLMATRSRMNERLLLLGMLGALAVWLCGNTDRRGSILSLTILYFGIAGLLLGQSRVMMGAVPVGLMIILILSNRQQRGRVALAFMGAVGVIGVLALIFLGDLLPLIISGITNRASTVSSAHTLDLSLVNRFYEWRATWQAFLTSPFVGQGFGVPYSFYSLEYKFTEVKYFTHNTYLGLLYRHGIIGFALFGSFVLLSFKRGLDSYRSEPQGLAGAVVLGSLAGLAALAVAALTEGTLLPVDGVFGYMYPLALLAGIRQRQANQHRL